MHRHNKCRLTNRESDIAMDGDREREERDLPLVKMSTSLPVRNPMYMMLRVDAFPSFDGDLF